MLAYVNETQKDKPGWVTLLGGFSYLSVTYNRTMLFKYMRKTRSKWNVLFVIGKSTHNQRIERLWRDVFEGCISLFYTMFYNLEQTGVLNPDNDIHLWCLHYVFLPIINRHLTNWRNAWVRHPLRSEGNSTPMQLWIRGLNRVWGSTSSISSEVFQVTAFSVQTTIFSTFSVVL